MPRAEKAFLGCKDFTMEMNQVATTFAFQNVSAVHQSVQYDFKVIMWEECYVSACKYVYLKCI